MSNRIYVDHVYLYEVKDNPQKGYDVNTSQATYYGVEPNVVICLLGRDFEYFYERTVEKDGIDKSRKLREVDLVDLRKYCAAHTKGG